MKYFTFHDSYSFKNILKIYSYRKIHVEYFMYCKYMFLQFIYGGNIRSSYCTSQSHFWYRLSLFNIYSNNSFYDLNYTTWLSRRIYQDYAMNYATIKQFDTLPLVGTTVCLRLAICAYVSMRIVDISHFCNILAVML